MPPLQSLRRVGADGQATQQETAHLLERFPFIGAVGVG
jgi:hypothetical protein